MAISFSLGGSKSSSKSRSSSQERSTQTTTRLTAQDQAGLRDLIAMFSGELQGEGPFTRDAALTDVAGMVQNLFTQYREQAVPQIMSQQQQTGGYGQSTTQMLANDAFARTVAEGTGLQLGAVQAYENLQNQRRQTSLGGLGTNLEALLKAFETTDLESSITSKSRGSSSGMSAGAGISIPT